VSLDKWQHNRAPSMHQRLVRGGPRLKPFPNTRRLSPPDDAAEAPRARLFCDSAAPVKSLGLRVLSKTRRSTAGGAPTGRHDGHTAHVTGPGFRRTSWKFGFIGPRSHARTAGWATSCFPTKERGRAPERGCVSLPLPCLVLCPLERLST